MTIYINGYDFNGEYVDTIQTEIRNDETPSNALKELLFEGWELVPIREESFEYQLEWNREVMMFNNICNTYFLLKHPHWICSTYDLGFDVYELDTRGD